MSELPQPAERFIRGHIRSVWDLELLLLLLRDPARSWSAPALVRELRASAPLVTDSLMALLRAGCIAGSETEGFRYCPANDEIEAGVRAARSAYGSFPVAVTKLIWEGPRSKIQDFADAFRLKKD